MTAAMIRIIIVSLFAFTPNISFSNEELSSLSIQIIAGCRDGMKVCIL